MTALRYFTNVNNPALSQLVQDWQKKYPTGGCLVLVAENDKELIPKLQSSFNYNDFKLVGSIFPNLIVDTLFENKGVLLFLFRMFPKYVLLDNIPVNQPQLREFIKKEFTALANYINPELSDNALFIIFDGIIPNISTILDNIYSITTNQAGLFGVNAGSESFLPIACLFDNHRIVGNGLLAMLLPGHQGAILAHNYRQLDEQLTATSTEGNCINRIADRPAFEAYQELVEKEFGVVMTVENFYEYGVHFPFGLRQKNATPLVRIPVKVKEDGALCCIGEIPPNTQLSLLEAIPPGSSETVDTIAKHPKFNNQHEMLSFYCAGRRLHLHNSAHTELRMLADKLTPVPVMGALSLGEINQLNQNEPPSFHNAALVVVPWQ